MRLRVRTRSEDVRILPLPTRLIAGPFLVGGLALIGGHVFVEVVFGHHQPEVFKVFAESTFKLRKYDV